jgi:adenine-specific DNA-methyltransferase
MPTLDWLNRADAFTTAARVPYRLLEPVSSHGSGAGERDNLLIQGDNLEALKALLPFYRGQVKCIFIDPPYNTKSAFEHYDDNLEHSQWLSMMLPRLQLLRELLREDGSIWVTIDDNEGHYLKVLMDEVFGRRNFVANVVWQSSDNSNNDAKTFSVDHNQVLVYSRDPGWLTNKSDAEQKRSHFKNPDNDPRGPWFDGNPLNSPKPRENLMYPLTAPNGYQIPHPPNGWRWEPDTMQLKLQSGEIRFNEAMTGIKRRTYLLEMKGLPPSTLWTDLLETGHNRQAKTEQKALRDQGSPDLFDTPKPEKLLAKVLQIATQANDLVLDSFLGSGTTAAVAHKMGRRWIGIEMGEHAATHCLPRLQKVLDGEPGGISAAVGWQGGGGFRFLRLGAPIFDADGCIHPEVRFATLAAFVWQQETGTARTPGQGAAGTPWLGTHYDIDSAPWPSDAGKEPISPENSPPDLFSAPPEPAPDATLVAGATPQAPRPVKAVYLLFNGILGDRRPAGGNVLTVAVLDALLAQHATTPAPEAPLVVYGEACRLGPARLALAHVTFRHIPYDVKAR